MKPTEPFITEPGVYDIPAELYHRDPVVGGSLSSSGARKLMPPSCPALFKAWQDGAADERSDALDFGKAAHRDVLGAGDAYVVIEGTGKDPDKWLTAADKAAVKEAREAGLTPIKRGDAETITAMAAALREHPVAATLLAPGTGRPEQTLVWPDGQSGIWCRALVDWLRTPVVGQRFVVVDYKTAAAADPDSISKAIWSWGYFQQMAWYCEAVEACGLALDPVAVLLVQIKTPPYLVVPVQIHPDDIGWGHVVSRKARDVYRHCLERDEWPGYADDRVISVSMPIYARYELEGAQMRGEFELEGATL